HHALEPAHAGQPHQDRQGDPRGRRGPGRRLPDGHQREPDHLADLPDRWSHGGRSGGALRRAVQPHQSLHRLHSGAEGLHRRGAGGDRQHSRRHAGRPGPGSARGLRGLVPVAPDRRGLRGGVQGHLRVLDPDPDPDLPPEGPARRGRPRTRMNPLNRPVPASILVAALLAATTWGVLHSPRAVSVFLLFQGSILLLYLARMPALVKGALTVITLGVLMPWLGTINRSE